MTFLFKLKKFFTPKKLITIIATAITGCIVRHYIHVYFPDLSPYDFELLLPSSISGIIIGLISGEYYDHMTGTFNSDINVTESIKPKSSDKLFMESNNPDRGEDRQHSTPDSRRSGNPPITEPFDWPSPLFSRFLDPPVIHTPIWTPRPLSNSPHLTPTPQRMTRPIVSSSNVVSSPFGNVSQGISTPRGNVSQTTPRVLNNILQVPSLSGNTPRLTPTRLPNSPNVISPSNQIINSPPFYLGTGRFNTPEWNPAGVINTPVLNPSGSVSEQGTNVPQSNPAESVGNDLVAPDIVYVKEKSYQNFWDPGNNRRSPTPDGNADTRLARLSNLDNSGRQIGFFKIDNISEDGSKCRVTYYRPAGEDTFFNGQELAMLMEMWRLFPVEIEGNPNMLNKKWVPLDEHRLMGRLAHDMERNAQYMPNWPYKSDHYKRPDQGVFYDPTKPRGFYQPWATDIANSIRRFKAETPASGRTRPSLDPSSTIFLTTFLNSQESTNGQPLAINRWIISRLERL